MCKKIVAFGEIMLRLSPANHLLLKDTSTFEGCYGGSESNVLVALSALGNRTEYVTAIPQNEIGEGCIRHLRRQGVGVSHILRQGNTLGLYFLEPGFGERASKVIYHRKHSAVSEIKADDLDYDAIFAEASLFHVSGISLALSDTCFDAVMCLAKEARARKIPVSFDFNYRSKLWSYEEAAPAFRAILPYVDICFGNTFDLSTFLGIRAESEEEAITEFFKRYPARVLCFSRRTVISSTVNEYAGYLYTLGGAGLSLASYGPCRFEILDRIGSGDAFSAGVLHVLSERPQDTENAIRYGVAAAVLKHSIKGDIFTLSESEIQSFLAQKTKEVQR